jgi:hypothetical protein
MSTGSLLFTLSTLERELHEPRTRSNGDRLAQLLHAGFLEFGRSGAVYTRSQVLARLPAESNPTPVHAQGFAVVELAPSVALLTYQSADIGPSGSLQRHANRSSIWRLEAAGWQIVFHQGTPTQLFERHAR